MSAGEKVILAPAPDYSSVVLRPALERILTDFGADLPKSGDRVMLKPNMVKALSRESCGQTDPYFVAEIAKLGLDLGWKLAVGDSPAIGSIHQTTKASGLDELLKKIGVPIVQLSGNVEVSWNGRPCSLAQQLSDFDALINLPKLKGHGQLYYSGAVKNLFGCIGGKKKVWLHMKIGDQDHGLAFAEMLLDQALAVKSSLSIMDGVNAMAGRGPIHGTPVTEGLVAASLCPVALDLALFKYLEGDVSQDPLMSLLGSQKWEKPCLDFPMGEVPRGDFYFPTPEQRKPISFRPWVLLRLAWRQMRSKLLAS